MTGLRTLAIAVAAFGLNGCTSQANQIDTAAPSAKQPVDFVGIYNGNSFETAMGMRIADDGTFEWGLSVGSLDMRSSGTWVQDGNRITLTTSPKPVPGEFRWSGYEKVPDDPMVKVTLPSGKPFGYAVAFLLCANGNDFFEVVPEEGWSPPEGECDAPSKLRLQISSYDIYSPEYDLAETFKLEPGETIVIKFHRNDMGVADFTGIVGTLKNGELSLEGGEWPMTFRKMPPRQPDP